MNEAVFISTEQVRLKGPSMQSCNSAGMRIPGPLGGCELPRHNLAGVDCNLASTGCCTAACQSALIMMDRLNLQCTKFVVSFAYSASVKAAL